MQPLCYDVHVACILYMYIYHINQFASTFGLATLPAFTYDHCDPIFMTLSFSILNTSGAYMYIYIYLNCMSLLDSVHV